MQQLSLKGNLRDIQCHSAEESSGGLLSLMVYGLGSKHLVKSNLKRREGCSLGIEDTLPPQMPTILHNIQTWGMVI